jgi:hypothetical protein
VQKIKQNLIVKAKLKKNYAKIKERELLENPDTFKSVYHDKDESEQGVKSHNMELHPDRQAMLDRPEVGSEQEQRMISEGRSRRRSNKRPKAKPFEKEEKLAQQRQAEAEARKKEMDERNRQRQLKLEERERFRKVMGKARTGGKNGQRKLGMESKVLLEKAKKIMSE